MRYQRDGFSVDAAIKKGRVLPDWFLEEPILLPGYDFYLQAFWDLSTTRSIGMGLGPIPWDKIVDYADRSHLETDVAQMFLRVIRKMDDAYLNWHVAESEKRTAMAKARVDTAPQVRIN